MEREVANNMMSADEVKSKTAFLEFCKTHDMFASVRAYILWDGAIAFMQANAQNGAGAPVSGTKNTLGYGQSIGYGESVPASTGKTDMSIDPKNDRIIHYENVMRAFVNVDGFCNIRGAAEKIVELEEREALKDQPDETPGFTQLAKAIEDEIQKYCDSSGLKLQHTYNTAETLRWFMATNITKGILPMLPKRESGNDVKQAINALRYRILDDLRVSASNGLSPSYRDGLSHAFDVVDTAANEALTEIEDGTG